MKSFSVLALFVAAALAIPAEANPLPTLQIDVPVKMVRTVAVELSSYFFSPSLNLSGSVAADMSGRFPRSVYARSVMTPVNGVE
ncbi:hypothetical protein E4U53_001802 [Claviceps sorghi]|nr:hypothetical protein E4U53_001802 [Claviceps sorghi]